MARSEPTTFPSGPSGAYLQESRDVCWSEPPDPLGLLIGSWTANQETSYEGVANDFLIGEDRIIRRVRWWGGYYYNDVPCEPGPAPIGFYLRIYLEADCLPSPPSYYHPVAEYFVEGAAGETFIGCQSELYPLYRYEADIDFHALGGVRYFLCVQMVVSEFGPPIWGRLAAASVTGCECAIFTNAYLEDWCLPISDIYGVSMDASQEFECDTPVAVQRSSWGRIRALFR